MEFQQLTPQRLLQAILSGCENLKQARKKLNEINFFPVADGDTGDNMAATAAAIIENAKEQPTVEKTLESVANASIMGARGNSGMMFSSFFNGLFQAHEGSKTLNTHHFAEMLKNASAQVRSSLMNPMEGTLLTVVENWAKLVESKSKDLTNFKTLCHEILNPLKDALHQHCQYTHKNSEKVLDAGALGFYHFIEGFTKALSEDNPTFTYHAQSVEHFEVPAQDHDFSGDAPTNRFCTEALLRDAHISPAQLQTLLTQFGDSIVVTGHQHLQRFHIHTNHPEKVFQKLQAMGRVANPKVDDMQRQFECHICKKRAVALLTDSSADLPIEIRDQHQIHLLPINIHFNEHHLLDPYTIDADNFYHSIQKNQQYPTTSAPNPLQIQNKFRELSQRHEKVIMVTVAEKLSSTYASACNLAQEFGNIHVVNSKVTSAAQSLFVHHAAQVLENQHDDFDEKLNQIQSAQGKIEFFVLVNKLDALMRSGRVDKVKGTFANYLGIKPIIKLNHEGQGTMHDRALSKKAGLMRLIKSAQKEQEKRQATIVDYAIVHAGNNASAEKLAELAKAHFGKKALYIGPVSAAIGLHAGAGCVGIAAMYSK
jgi:DegV family protein with EDD domain